MIFSEPRQETWFCFSQKTSQKFEKGVLITSFKILYFYNFSVLFPKIITPKDPLVDASQGESPETTLVSLSKESSFLVTLFKQIEIYVV